MAICDVCGKNSLLPERFGSVNICKVCFLKANGLLWKYQYDRYDEAEKQRQKALTIVSKQNFPDRVINAINEYFLDQLDTMVECDCCKEYVQHLNKFGSIYLCRQCLNQIDIAAWRETKYEDNVSVENNRQKVLNIAKKHNFSPATITEINLHFDRLLQKGLLFVIDSKCGQKIRVFETHCILTTKDQFDVETFSKMYGKVLKKRHPKENMFSNGAAKALARNVLTGGIVRTGINLATSAAINATADAMAPEKGMFRVVKGEFKIDYSTYGYVEFQRSCDDDIGFIRFVNTLCGGNPSEDIIFFFMGDNSKPEAAYNSILEGISAKKAVVSMPKPEKVRVHGSAADEILKYKNLLDMGAITQEEYDAKKRELLDI